MRLMRGEPYPCLLLSLIFILCNLTITSAQRAQYWAVPLVLLALRVPDSWYIWVTEHLPWRAVPGALAGKLKAYLQPDCAQHHFHYNCHSRCDTSKSATKIQMGQLSTKTNSPTREGSTGWLCELNIHRTRGKKQGQVSTQKVLDQQIFPHIFISLFFTDPALRKGTLSGISLKSL